VVDLCVQGSFEEEGTTPNTCRYKLSQGQGKRADTESVPPCTKPLKVSEGLGTAMLLGRSVDDDDGSKYTQTIKLYFSSDCEKNSQKNSDVDLLVRAYQ
jgi:hypothetical protein